MYNPIYIQLEQIAMAITAAPVPTVAPRVDDGWSGW